MGNVVTDRPGGQTRDRSLATDHPLMDKSNAGFLCCLVALFALILSPIFGTLLAGLFVISAGAVMALYPVKSATDLLKFSPLLAIPLLAMLSTLWSEAPERTLRASLQMLFTVAAAIVICRQLKAMTLIRIAFVSTLICCLLAVPSIPTAMQHHFALIGPYGSKNQMAYSAQTLLTLSLPIILGAQQGVIWRLVALLSLVFSVFLLVLAHSAGANVACVLVIFTFCGLMILGRLALSLRIAALITGAVIILVALAILPTLINAWADFQLHVLNKDATLTGRTYLWDYAARLSALKPVLGSGYYAFWRLGNIDAEWLWRWGGVPNRTGFNFHNTFVEMKVGLGWVGVVLLCATCLAIAALGIFRQITRPSAAMACLLSALLVLYVRSFAESDMFGPFSYMTVFMIATAIYATDGLRRAPQQGHRLAQRDGRRQNRLARQT